MERLSIESIIATGHDLTVFSYEHEALARQGLGCPVLDARLILDDPRLDRMRQTRPSYFSDVLRVEGMAQDRGTWLDLDIVLVKPLPSDAYLFGWEKPGRLCNAVLRMPADSPILLDYLRLCRATYSDHSARTWGPWYRRLNHRRQLLMRRLRGRLPPAPKCGVGALTQLVRDHGLRHLAKPSAVFYPIPPTADAMHAIAGTGTLLAMIKPDTVAVHLWRTLYRDTHGDQLLDDVQLLHNQRGLRSAAE